MATPTERIQSILTWVLALQRCSDEDLEAVASELAEVDSILDGAVEAIEGSKDDEDEG